MEDKEFYRGRFDHVGDRKLNSVRIFISSTFTDTTEERNGLIERVYPRLRDYCVSKYNIQFQYSDMRWGIQSTASNTHSTVDMCLQELDTCARLSMATNCVILLSHRYGSRLVPAWISSDVFQLLYDSLSTNIEEQSLLSQMYQLDENYLDRKHFLRSIDDHQQWPEFETKLQLILRKAADRCYKQGTLSEEQRKEFYISVTAKEIYRALQNNHHTGRRIVCFFREIIDIDELDSKFHERETHEMLEELKTGLHQALDPSDIYTYQVRWNDQSERTNYFSRFYEDFYRAIQSQIDFHMKITLENQQKSILYDQVLEHAIQCNLLTQRYYPRQDILQQIRNYITSARTDPCVLMGESGTGKSSIMAKLVSEIPTWSDSVSVIIRFLGATPSSSDIRRPFLSTIEQICTIYHLEMPSKLENVREALENVLMEIPKNERLILLLDSIDQLQISDLRNLSRWLPTKFPSNNIKLILSTIPQIEIGRETIEIGKQLRSIYSNHLTEIEIHPFDENIARQVLSSWLEQDRRCLTPVQYEWLEPKFSFRHSITPLFISLLYDQTLTWHSFDQTPDKAFLAIKTTSAAIGYLYQQLGKKHGQMLFRRSMRYLQLSGGLSELEMEDILSSDDQILQSVFVHYLPPLGLFRLPSTLWIRIRNDMHKYLVEKDIDGIPCIYFYHRSFQYYQPMDVKQLIQDSEENATIEQTRLQYFAYQYQETFDMSYSSKLASKYNLSTPRISVNRCLTAQKPFKNRKKKSSSYNLRRLHQLYLNLNRYDFAHPWTVFNYDFLEAFLRCGEYKLSQMLYEFSIGAHDPNGELRFLLKQFEASSSIVNSHPQNFPFELIHRLFPFLDQLPPLTSHLLERCVVHCPLQLITASERTQSLVKHSLSEIIYLDMDFHNLFVVTKNQQLYLFATGYYELFITEQFSLIEETFVSFLCRYPYVCCLTSKSMLIIVNCQTKKMSTAIPCGKLVSFVDEQVMLIVSSDNKSLEFWDCSKEVLLSKSNLSDHLIGDCLYKSSIITVTFKDNSMISYYSFDGDFQLTSLRINNENPPDYPHRILLDDRSEFCYSLKHPQASLIIHDDNSSKEILTNIDFHSSPVSVHSLSQSNAIAWLTSTSLLIFNPLIKYKLFQPFELLSSTTGIEYDVIHDHHTSPDFLDQTNFLICIHRQRHLIDIYEWRYDDEQQKHIHRQLTHLQLDIPIDQCVFRAGWFDGITLFCSDGTNLYKYNATLLTYLVSEKPRIPSQKIDGIPRVYSDQFLTLKDDDHSLKIFSLNDDSTLRLHLAVNSILEQHLTKTSSHLLVIETNKAISIYSLLSSERVWSTTEFQYEQVHIHSLVSSFLLMCPHTKQILQIDTNTCQLTQLGQLSTRCLSSTITADNRLFILTDDQKTLVEFHIEQKKMNTLIPIQINSTKIGQIYSVFNHLLLHTDDGCMYLWSKENEPVVQLEKTSRWISKDNRLVLVSSTDDRMVILYDLHEKLRGVIQLDTEAGQCEAMDLSHLNEEAEQFLFIITQDRLLRMYRVSNGKQMAKLFIQTNLDPFIGVLRDCLLLKVASRLCIIKILSRKSLPKKSSAYPLFDQSMWMTCHHDNCTWSSS